MNAYVKFYDFIVHHRNELLMILQLLEGYDADARIFEGGTGTGRLAIPLAERGYTVHGYEKNTKMIQALKQNISELHKDVQKRINIVQKDFTEIDYPPESFDFALFSSNTLLLVTDFGKQQEILKQIHKILKTLSRKPKNESYCQKITLLK